jgi:hypothetical protein
MDLIEDMERDLVVCVCGHIESFHDDGKDGKGTWCLALNCGCGERHPKISKLRLVR